MGAELKVGVVGYCPPTKFDETQARRLIIEAYSDIMRRYPNRVITVVSHLTNVGVLKIAYEEATKRGWRTVGIACERAADHPLYPVDERFIVGNNWGNESASFIDAIDAIIRVGGGQQPIRETEDSKKLGKATMEYDLPTIQ